MSKINLPRVKPVMIISWIPGRGVAEPLVSPSIFLGTVENGDQCFKWSRKSVLPVCERR